MVHGRVVGTYLHGPVLARNPRLADQLLEWVTGPLAPLADPQADLLHEERYAEVTGARGWSRLGTATASTYTPAITAMIEKLGGSDPSR